MGTNYLSNSMVMEILRHLMKENPHSDDVSPNFVAEYAYNKGFTNLTSKEINDISDMYKESI